MAKVAALGKGLSALMGSASKLAAPEPSAEKGETIRQVSRSVIVPSPLQPRKTFRHEELTELVDSIKERGSGCSLAAPFASRLRTISGTASSLEEVTSFKRIPLSMKRGFRRPFLLGPLHQTAFQNAGTANSG